VTQKNAGVISLSNSTTVIQNVLGNKNILQAFTRKLLMSTYTSE